MKKTSMINALLVAGALAVAPAAQAEVLDLTGYTGAPLAVAGSAPANPNLYYWNLAGGAYSGSDVFLSASFTVAPGSSIAAGDFVGVWLDTALSTGNTNHDTKPMFGIRGGVGDGLANDVFARSQYVAAQTNSGANGLPGSVLTAGQSFTLLVHVFKSGASTFYNSVEAWFNPTAADTLATADLKPLSVPAGSSLSSFSMIGIRSAGLEGSDSVSVSNLKVATTFGEVSPVPEASSLAMLLAGLGMMGFIARRRLGD